ncbi:MAG: hypothetical protein P4L65_04535 [Legionella sp.]|nr:hypothetical protein [Legionella sp.]
MSINYSQASHFLSSVDADWSLLIERIGPCILETRPDHEPYEALIRKAGEAWSPYRTIASWYLWRA